MKQSKAVVKLYFLIHFVVNDSQLLRLLEERSPWRARTGWQADDPDLRAASELPLAYEPDVLAGIRPGGMYLLRGPRRVGKSLELKRTIARLLDEAVNPRTVFYASCDGLSAQDLRRLIAQGHSVTRTLDGPRYWLIDEVTAVPGWSAVVKDMRDQHLGFREACVVLTGSSGRDLQQARKDLADRRGGVVDSERLLLPMSFRSFCGCVGGLESVPDAAVAPRDLLSLDSERAIFELEPWRSDLIDAWELFLAIGGFPRAVGEFVAGGAVSPGFVEGLWDVVIGDAIRATRMAEATVAALLARLVENLCSPINATRIATDVGLAGHRATAERIDDLVSAFLAWRCYQMRDARPYTAAQSKLYFVDPLIAQLPARRGRQIQDPDPSRLTEQQIGLALSRAADSLEPTSFVEANVVMHERTATGAEIDFVGPELGVPVECKYTDGRWRREAQTMRARYGGGVMATRSVLSVERSEPVWALPAGMLAWLLGA